MRALAKLAVVGIVIVVVLQFVRPSIPVKPAAAELQAPLEVRHILEKDCYACHSDERRLAWFDEIVPAYWLVRYDVLKARDVLNFSTLASKPVPSQKAALYESVNMIQLGAMPLPRFLAVHPEARVTPEDLATLKAYLAPWTPAPTQSTTTQADGETPPATLASVVPEPNGFPFPADFENWKPLTTTDRGDNNTFRFVLGNDIAVKAAQSGNISPWPDGTRFAKIAWQQELGPDGLIHPGAFWQVEFMLKDAQRYKDTDGWNWARWRGLDLKPYGADARFVNECTGCHAPVRGDDYVYSLPMTAAKADRTRRGGEQPCRSVARQPAISANRLECDHNVRRPKLSSTATLYGDDAAMRAVQARAASAGAPAYPEGAGLALVTWAQREDPHWFGARIPDVPLSVEFIQVPKPAQPAGYRRFAGAGLTGGFSGSGRCGGAHPFRARPNAGADAVTGSEEYPGL